jgi:hypothetical protein
MLYYLSVPLSLTLKDSSELQKFRTINAEVLKISVTFKFRIKNLNSIWQSELSQTIQKTRYVKHTSVIQTMCNKYKSITMGMTMTMPQVEVRVTR